jgi:hypothetical protein
VKISKAESKRFMDLYTESKKYIPAIGKYEVNIDKPWNICSGDIRTPKFKR